jgi:NAD-dependent deacetylase
MSDRDEKLRSAQSILKSSKYVVVLAGAGLSQESGVPTFRGADGLWKQFRAEELATPSAFARNPELVWEWYCWRRSIIAKAEPNPAHLAIVKMEKGFEQFVLITQNVDGLHRRAGSRKFIEIHGCIWESRCVNCHNVVDDHETDHTKIPACKRCGGRLRPNVVWFGEPIPEMNFRKSIYAAQNCDVMIVVGTSGYVQPAASLPFHARQSGAKVIDVNVEPTQISEIAEIFLQGKAGEILPELLI